MDSKNIFISSQTYLPKISWQKDTKDSEWCFIGDNVKKANSLIDHFFANEQMLYLVVNRHNSRQELKIDIAPLIESFLEQISFYIWDVRFENAIEFNRIGVYRIGRRAI